MERARSQSRGRKRERSASKARSDKDGDAEMEDGTPQKRIHSSKSRWGVREVKNYHIAAVIPRDGLVPNPFFLEAYA